MTAQPTDLTTVASVLRRNGNLSTEARLVRDADRVGETTEAESMAVETQDAADAEGGPTDQDMRIARKALDQLYADQYAAQTGLPAFDRAASTSSLDAGEGPDVTHPAPPVWVPFPWHPAGRFEYAAICLNQCPAYRLLEEHESGDRQGLGAVRGLVNVLIGLLALAVFAGLTFWVGTKF